MHRTSLGHPLDHMLFVPEEAGRGCIPAKRFLCLEVTLPTWWSMRGTASGSMVCTCFLVPHHSHAGTTTPQSIISTLGIRSQANFKLGAQGRRTGC